MRLTIRLVAEVVKRLAKVPKPPMVISEAGCIQAEVPEFADDDGQNLDGDCDRTYQYELLRLKRLREHGDALLKSREAAARVVPVMHDDPFLGGWS